MDIGERIILWYSANKRDLPWRNTQDPYRVWISEIILQQTRVVQGTPYYNRFIRLFPKVFDLALAPTDGVLKVWQGLGYYSRAHNLHLTSKKIAFEMGGVFPSSFIELKNLPGIGDYTAAAIASFCFGESVPVLDGNVYRVLSRILGLYTVPISRLVKEEYFKQAISIMKNHPPDLFNQGIMELGALVCKPVNPLCNQCPLSMDCFAFLRDQVMNLPVKKVRNKLKLRYFNYIVLKTREGYPIKKRNQNDIWPGLFEFPLIEAQAPDNWEDLKESPTLKSWVPFLDSKLIPQKIEYSQILSHQKIFFTFWVLDLQNLPYALANFKEGGQYLTVQEENLNQYAFGKVTHKFVKQSIQSGT